MGDRFASSVILLQSAGIQPAGHFFETWGTEPMDAMRPSWRAPRSLSRAGLVKSCACATAARAATTYEALVNIAKNRLVKSDNCNERLLRRNGTQLNNE